MNADEQFQQALDESDWQTAKLALNRLEQEAIEAIQTTDSACLETAEIKLAAVIRAQRGTINNDLAQPYLSIGILSGFHRILRSLREDKPARSDIEAARKSKNRIKFLKALREGVALRANDIQARTSIPHLSTVSETGKGLEQAGLVRRDRIGKGATYLLTLRGNIVAKHLAEEERDWEPVVDNTDALTSESKYFSEWINNSSALSEELRALLADYYRRRPLSLDNEQRDETVFHSDVIDPGKGSFWFIHPIITPEEAKNNWAEGGAECRERNAELSKWNRLSNLSKSP